MLRRQKRRVQRSDASSPDRASGARTAVVVAGSLALSVLVACAESSGRDEASVVRDLDELVRLQRNRDYFGLRDRLGRPAADELPRLRVLRAATAHAFNDPERSNALLDSVLAGGSSLSDSLRWEALRLRARNLLRLYRYGEAADAFERLATAPPAFVDSAERADVRNTLRLTRTLEDVPPQRILSRSASTLRRVGRGEVEVLIGDSVRRHAIDTGANLSVLVRSEAETLGLEVRTAGLEVGTSTDLTVTADLAVAERVRIGHVELGNVVFLVVPDEMFTFPDRGLVLRGLVGFPVVEALGELRFRETGSIEVPARVPDREPRNLALHDLTPYVRVDHAGEGLVCALDTGNDRTVFYEPFFRRFRSRIEADGTPDTARYGGAGGVRTFPGYRLRDVRLRVGGASVTLDSVHVHTASVARTERSNVLDCNLGRDVLTRRGGYTLNFRSMSLLLR